MAPWCEESLRLSPTVHFSVTDWLTNCGVAGGEPRAEDGLQILNNGSSDEASGNSAILSIRGEFTETSGEFSRFSILVLWPGVSYIGNGRDTLPARRELLLTGFLERNCKKEK